MATFATPGTFSKRCRIVQYVIIDKSITECFLEEIPIFIQRLVADKGGNITGGKALMGKNGVAMDTRSCTNCRAVIRSVPGSKIILISERPGTDLDRITSNPATPFSDSSNGIVTSCSTSSGDSPRAGV